MSAWTAPAGGRPGPGDAAPVWLSLCMGLAAALVAALLLGEVFFVRPGYGIGDETAQIRDWVAFSQGGVFSWNWAQGSLQRAGLWLCLRLAGQNLGALHAPALAVLALELALLWRLTRRWFSAEAAAWAVLADLLCAATWLRSRSILSYHWLPLELLILACLASKIRRPWAAVAWGAAGAFLLLDYEGALAALPGLWLACAWREAGLRRHWLYGLAGAALVAAALVLRQSRVVGDYVQLRMAVNWGPGCMAIVRAWAQNLGQLLVGGRPLPYLGVDAWPAFAAWALPFLCAGMWSLRKGPGLGLALWALSATLITQAATAPWGLPSHRLVAAWPALCMIAGAGAEALRRFWWRVPPAAWALFLCLGLGGEANAFYRHMAFHGRQVYGRAALLQAAASDARSAESLGAPVSTALFETRSNDVRFFIGPSPGLAGRSAPVWVFLPTDFRVPAAAMGPLRLYQASKNDVPILVLLAPPGQNPRFQGMERDLRPLLDSGSPADEAAWLARPGAEGDDWAYAAVLERHLRRLWTGLPVDQALMDALTARPALTPGPLSLMGSYLVARDPAAAAAMLGLALRVDPAWGPALDSRVEAFTAQGETDAARAAGAQRDAHLGEGTWRDLD